MAEQEIDKLLLEIEVEDKTAGGSDKLVERFATTISKLNQEIAKLDVAKIESLSRAMSALGSGGGKGVSSSGGGTRTKSNPAIAGLKKELKELEEQRAKTLKGKEEILSADFRDEYKKQLVQGYESTIAKYDSKIAEVQSKIQQASAQQSIASQLPNTIEKASANTQKLNSLTDIQKLKLSEVREQLKSQTLTQEEYVDLKEKELRLEKQIKGSSKNSFTSALKRVAVYRAIRAILKFVVDALKEGAEQIAQISPEFNKTWSSVLTSLDKIKGSLATIGANLLPIIEPILRIVADLLVTVSNTIGKILASFNGTGKAIQANTKHQRDYNKELKKGALLSFDTFTTLQAQEQSDLYSVEDTGELGSGLAGLLDSITPIMNFVNQLITTITDVLMPIIVSVADVVDGVVDQIKGAFNILAGLLKLLTGDFEGAWDLIGEGFVDMINGIANMFIALGKFIIDALNFLFIKTNPLFWILKSAGIDVGGKIESWNADWSARAWSPIKNHAFGGAYNTADLFYANENGQTELIASTNSGGGAVMNMQQLEGAIFNGMMRAMSTGSGENAIYLDGNKVGTYIAGSNGFRSEANRRNTSLNWR